MFGKKISDVPPPLGTAAAPVVARAQPTLPLGLRVAVNSLTSSVATTGQVSNGHGLQLVRYRDLNLETPSYITAKQLLISDLLDQVDFQTLEQFSADKKRMRVAEACAIIIPKITVPLTSAQITLLTAQALDEILGFGPIEPLLRDPDVNDIMINTAKKVYIENQGKMLMTDIEFANEQHLVGVIQRIVSRVGRRIDEANPMVDARMPDGSRFNAIIPPLALDGALVSIRKFKKNKMPLSDYIAVDSMSAAMAEFLAIASAIRLNIIISGGTGSGKTTLLNALSGHIDPAERVITIEDAAELMLHQPHVLRLETRPASTEGRGEINQRQLMRNALRMRPDRIILGEMRGDEVIDVLSAMNTGHDGSMGTLHANNPREAISRMENMIAMGNLNIPTSAVREQIASAINVIIQVQRLRDGSRKVTHVSEITGMEGEVVTMQDLFVLDIVGEDEQGKLITKQRSTGLRPKFFDKARAFGVEKFVLDAMEEAYG